MKNLILAILFILMLPVTAKAVRNDYLLLDAATGTGTGQVLLTTNISKALTVSLWACDLTTTGSPSTVTIKIEGNQGNTSLFSPTGLGEHTMSSAERAAGIASFALIDTPVTQIRGNLVVLLGGTSPTVTLFCRGIR